MFHVQGPPFTHLVANLSWLVHIQELIKMHQCLIRKVGCKYVLQFSPRGLQAVWNNDLTFYAYSLCHKLEVIRIRICRIINVYQGPRYQNPCHFTVHNIFTWGRRPPNPLSWISCSHNILTIRVALNVFNLLPPSLSAAGSTTGQKPQGNLGTRRQCVCLCPLSRWYWCVYDLKGNSDWISNRIGHQIGVRNARMRSSITMKSSSRTAG